MAKKKKAAGPQKTCPKCGASNHVRKSACICGHKFRTKAKAVKKVATKKKQAAPKKKKVAPTGNRFTDALQAEKEALQQRIDKIDGLLDSY